MGKGSIPFVSLLTMMASTAILTKRTQENDLSELLQAPFSDLNSTELPLHWFTRFISDSIILPFHPRPQGLVIQS